MSAPLYTVVTSAAVALSAATAKSVIGVKSGAAFGLILKEVQVYFDGTSGSGTPVLIEVCYCTWATNSPGTNSTSRTPAQVSGRAIAHGVTAASNWTTEPTALTVLDEKLIHPQAGVLHQIPLSDEFDCAVSEGFAIRVTAPGAVNCRGTIKFGRA